MRRKQYDRLCQQQLQDFLENCLATGGIACEQLVQRHHVTESQLGVVARHP